MPRVKRPPPRESRTLDFVSYFFSSEQTDTHIHKCYAQRCPSARSYPGIPRSPFGRPRSPTARAAAARAHPDAEEQHRACRVSRSERIRQHGRDSEPTPKHARLRAAWQVR
ncbi:unnamed protein product [Ixodes pacificus]